MPDPRKFNNWEGVDGNYLTFKYDSTIVHDITKAGGSVSVGLAVTLTGDGIVGLTADGNRVRGKLIKVEPDGYCNVQTDGGMQLPLGNAAVATPGTAIVGALGAASAKGYIRAANTAVAAETVAAQGEVLDDTVATGIWVKL